MFIKTFNPGRIASTKNGIEIKVPKKRHFTIRGMVKLVTEDNLHAEMDWGAPRGNELW